MAKCCAKDCRGEHPGDGIGFFVLVVLLLVLVNWDAFCKAVVEQAGR